MTMIDLGEVSQEDFQPRIPVDRRRVLRAALALITLAGVLVLAGSAGKPAPAEIRDLWTIDANSDGIGLDDRALYLVRDDGKPGLVAYDLATGAMRWRAPAGHRVSNYGVRPAGDTVLLPADPFSVTRKEDDGSTYFYVTNRTTIAFDAATGRHLWEVTGDAQPLVDSGTALVEITDDNAQTVGLELVRLRDGTPIWSKRYPQLLGWTMLPADHPTSIAIATMDGELSTVDITDGTSHGRGRIPWADGKESGWLMATGKYLTILHNTKGLDDTATTIYDPVTLRPLWRTSYVQPCGELMCSIDDKGVSGLDPATGRVVWNAYGMQNMQPYGDDRVLLSTAGELPTVQLADSRTGDLLGEPSTGQAAYGSGADTGHDGRLLLTRPSKQPIGQLVVTEIRLADGTHRDLGTIGSFTELRPCLTTPGYLACFRPDGLHVMAVG
jgi:hypothetical protein